MKAKVLFATVLLALSSVASQAYYVPPVWGTTLDHMNLDPQLLYGSQVRAASIRIEFARNVATLAMLLGDKSCPPPTNCIAVVPPQKKTIALPIVTKATDKCGTKLIIARSDKSAVDGPAEELTIRDNTSNHCPTYAKQPATQVLYRTLGRGEARIETRSMFDGGALHAIFPAANH